MWRNESLIYLYVDDEENTGLRQRRQIKLRSLSFMKSSKWFLLLNSWKAKMTSRQTGSHCKSTHTHAIKCAHTHKCTQTHVHTQNASGNAEACRSMLGVWLRDLRVKGELIVWLEEVSISGGLLPLRHYTTWRSVKKKTNELRPPYWWNRPQVNTS